MADKKEIIDWIQLINTENIGPITFYKLLEKFGSAENALLNLPNKYKVFPRSSAQKELEHALSKNVHIILYKDSNYPINLKELEDAPPLIYVLGNLSILQNPLSLSIVGARNASTNGRKIASRIAFELTNNEVMIISGMARGIDSAAHKGSMYANNQNGCTIAVLGTGVDVVYPKENQELYEQIKVQGAIISEFPMGTEPQANNFPRRNRIVSALSLGTLVVEATINSGSLITARLALEQGKDIFAIPGSPNDARALGPNKLIKDGAILVDSADDILNIMNINNHHQIKQIQKVNKPDLFNCSIDKPERTVIQDEIKLEKKGNLTDYLDHDGVYVDELIRMTNMNASEILLELLELEMSGIIERQAGNKVALIKRS